MSKIIAGRMIVGDDELHFRDDDAQKKLEDLIVQEKGNSKTAVMSQAAATEEFDKLSEEIDEVKETLDRKIELGINFLDYDNYTAGGYINSEDGTIAPYENWAYSDYFNILGGEYYFVTAESGNFVIDHYCYYATFDKNKNFISGGVTNSSNNHKVIVPNDAYYIRVSNYTQAWWYAYQPMLIKVEDFNETLQYERPKCEIINYKEKCPKLLNIVNAYVEKDMFYDLYLYFKFDYIEYEYEGKTKRTPFSYIRSSIPDPENVHRDGLNVTEWSSCYVSDVAFVFDDKSVVFDFSDGMVKVSDTVNANQILLMRYNDFKHTFEGVLNDFYRNDLINPIEYSAEKLPLMVALDCDRKENELYSLIDSDKFVFGYLGDTHIYGYEYSNERNNTIKAINRVDEHLNLNSIIHVGDVSLSKGDAYTAIRTSLDKFTNRDKLIFAEGNHDRWIEEPRLTRKEYHNLVLRHSMNDENAHLVKDRAYFYRDIPKKEIRVVVCTQYNMEGDYTLYRGFDHEQMEWLANTALANVPSGYHILVVVHSSPIYRQEGMPDNVTVTANRDVFTGILESYKNGTDVAITSTEDNDVYDIYTVNTHFASKGAGIIIAVLSGDNHRDAMVERNGIKYITIACGYNDLAMYGTSRPVNTYQEIAFDICILDKSTRTVILKRFGYGSDREFSY